MTINEFAAEVHKNAVEHGWWEAALTIRKIRTPVVPRRARSPKGSRQSLPT